ncbi:MAG: hypothetical protein DMF79_10375 [Acidobacteria bacterium]|nr:MAG: hypothetical protein DMF79_10375 [Acidobacteriota bacterium]
MSDRDQEDRALTLRGTIEETSVPELMRSVLGSGETGVLTFHRRGVTKSVYLHMGRIVYARSSDPDERLGENLLLRGKITVRQYLEASKQIRPGRRLGTILIELNAIDSEDLLSSLEHHVKEMLLDVFTWTTGEYERAVIFRLGKLLPRPKGPGLTIVAWPVDRMVRVSLRTVVLDVPPQDVITRDNVTVKVNAVVYFRVVDPLKSVVQVENYLYATSQEAQTTLRSILGQAHLDELLSERERLGNALQEVIDQHTDPWGVKVTQVAVKAVDLPQEMQRAMAKQAEAEREKRAKEALSRVTTRYATLFYGIDLKQYGRADYEQMLANVADLPPKQRKALMIAGLNELIGSVQAGVREHHGPEEEAVVSGIIKDGFRRLSPGG